MLEPIRPLDGSQSRLLWFEYLTKISSPVLSNLAHGTLRQQMPIEAQEGAPMEREKFTHLEAVARLLAGIAPWLGCETPPPSERSIHEQFRSFTLQGLENAVNPNSPDALNFHYGFQPVVDTAFLSQALLRAPHFLFEKLEPTTQNRLVDCLRASRSCKPVYNNWLLFSAMVEAALHKLTGQYDCMRVDYAIKQHLAWYRGDSFYSDGPHLHCDYYNSFVIHPMFIDVLNEVKDHYTDWQEAWNAEVPRARRHATILEKLVAPDGTFPAVGRSLAYRCGAFHALAQSALRNDLEIHPSQARGALTAVIQRTLEPQGTFDPSGWLRIGLCGSQPDIGEWYISTGSLYLCAAAFLPMGLPLDHLFWAGEPMPWSSLRVWNSEPTPADHSLSG